jgi:DNA polymerase III subunit gamma/tau
MSYQVIARKWRPQTFEEVTGQEAITQTLRNALEHDRLHHAYIFSGARGVGKTTTARLLAKSLNCHSSDKPVVIPCNNCPSCSEIAEGRSIDVLEIDAASHTGVDNVRQTIIEGINIAPARDRYKVFIIDEVHMLSTSSFNALLKTLEEPPPRVEFIMATTELHKLPETILSRCQEFEFKTIPLVKIYDRLKIIAEAENISIDEKALREIARAGEGSMRDAQSAFDQVISFSGETIEVKDVTNALGIASAEMLTKTITAITDKKPDDILKIVEELIHRGQDLRNYCRDLLSFFRDLLVSKISEAESLLDSAILSRAELLKFAENFTEADFIRFFNSLADTETKLLKATQPRYVLEIGLIKLIEMQRVTAIETILERLSKLESVSPIEEKKTLNNDERSINSVQQTKKPAEFSFPADEVPFPVQKQTPKTDNLPQHVTTVETKSVEKPELIGEEEPYFDADSRNSAYQIPNFTPPIYFVPISTDDFTHVEDPKLDSAFEERLEREGDNLQPIKNASSLIAELTGENIVKQNASINRTAIKPTNTKPRNDLIPTFEAESTEIPTLPENPTEDELWHYAQNHPKIKSALRIFRGKIISVEKN